MKKVDDSQEQMDNFSSEMEIIKEESLGNDRFKTMYGDEKCH